MTSVPKAITVTVTVTWTSSNPAYHFPFLDLSRLPCTTAVSPNCNIFNSSRADTLQGPILSSPKSPHSLALHLPTHSNHSPLHIPTPPFNTATLLNSRPYHWHRARKYVVARSGHAASPEEIIASCQALQAHIQKTQEDAEEKIREWERSLKEHELAEKRRVAPGWLDRDEKILQPNRTSLVGTPNTQEPNYNIMDQQEEPQQQGDEAPPRQDHAGDELDRAFGGMGLQNR